MEVQEERRGRGAAFDMSTAFVFMNVAEQNSFAAAASQLGITRSAISKRIAQLERELGVTLLTRTPRSISLTDVGKSFYEHCREIRDAMEKAAEEVRGQDDQPKGLLRVSVPSSFGKALITPLIPVLLGKRRQLRVNVHFGEQYVDVVGGGYDVVIRLGQKLTDSSLYARRLATTYRVLVASPRYLQRYGTPKHPKELRRHYCLGRGKAAESPVVWSFSDGKESFGISVSCVLSGSCDAALIAAACMGMGVAYVPELFVRRELSQRALQKVLSPYCHAQELGVFAVHPYRKCPAKVQMFIELVEKHLRAAASRDAESALVHG